MLDEAGFNDWGRFAESQKKLSTVSESLLGKGECSCPQRWEAQGNYILSASPLTLWDQYKGSGPKRSPDQVFLTVLHLLPPPSLKATQIY